MKYTAKEKQNSGVGGYYDPFGNSEIEGSILSAGKVLSNSAYGEIAKEEDFPFSKDPLRKDRRKFVSFNEEEHSPVFFPDEEKRQVKVPKFPVVRVACTGRRYIPGRAMSRVQGSVEETREKAESKVVSLPKNLNYRQVVSYLAQASGRM